MSTRHTTITLDRTYPVPPAKVFAAWSNPAAKHEWFAGPEADHDLDFRPGGQESIRARGSNGRLLTFDSTYQDIIDDQRIVFTSTLAADGRLATVSLTTVTFAPDPAGTLLTLVQQGTFLDGEEDPAWREQGTRDQLEALAKIL